MLPALSLASRSNGVVTVRHGSGVPAPARDSSLIDGTRACHDSTIVIFNHEVVVVRIDVGNGTGDRNRTMHCSAIIRCGDGDYGSGRIISDGERNAAGRCIAGRIDGFYAEVVYALALLKTPARLVPLTLVTYSLPTLY